ncbi:MAG TPA: HPr family phosphocarrier protein [Firmicutes bacterium]|nr:HPr family phosphocarrier protein [Bacillota bacterium]
MTEVIVTLGIDLQARVASAFVQVANRFESKISLIKDHRVIDAKSIMGVMSLGIRKGTEVLIRAEGSDAPEALIFLQNFLMQEEI